MSSFTLSLLIYISLGVTLANFSLNLLYSSTGSTTSPLPASSRSLSLSLTFHPLSMSHQGCHQPPLRLMPANMAVLLCARSFLLSLLFALTLDEFIKGKRQGMGENSCKSCSFTQLTALSLAGRVFVFQWSTKCVFACVILHIYHYFCR